MNSPRITFTYSAGSTTDPWWVRLEQEDLPDDTATLDDAADLLDTLYNLDACADEQSEEATDPSTEAVEQTVDITVDRMACRFDADGNVDVEIRVIRSRQDAPYKLSLSGGTLLTTETITEPYSQTILVESAASITLDYPVVDSFSGAWTGTVYSEQGRISPPSINRTGNTLDFGGVDVATGSITVSYLTEYDRCTLTILGVDGEAGACTARVFFHGLVDELELEIPEASEPLASCTSRWTVAPIDYDIECVQIVTVSTRCQCTDDEVATRTYEEIVDCPDSVVRCQGATTECRHVVGSVTVPEYVECADDNEVTGRPGMIHSLSTRDYYEEHCCAPPSFPLPDCPEKKISHKGGMKLSGGARQYYNIYGPKLRITPVSPAGGICGDWTIRQEVRSSNCCDGVEPLAWDATISPDVMSPNSAVNIGVTGGGRYPHVWTVVGQGMQFSNGSTRITTTGGVARLSALPTACGTASVTVTDGCSTVTAHIRMTVGQWVQIIGPTDLVPLPISGGPGDYVGPLDDGGQHFEKIGGQYKLIQYVASSWSGLNCAGYDLPLCGSGGIYEYDPNNPAHHSAIVDFAAPWVDELAGYVNDHCFWSNIPTGTWNCTRTHWANHNKSVYQWQC